MENEKLKTTCDKRQKTHSDGEFTQHRAGIPAAALELRRHRDDLVLSTKWTSTAGQCRIPSNATASC